jgi:hypothetical protein
MAERREVAGNERILRTASGRFPHSEFAIRKLMNRSEAFRDMCEELAEAERALSNVSNLAPAVREARRAEWQELVERLVDEVAAAIRESESWRSHREG